MILMKRNIWSTLFELFYPVAMFLLIIAIRDTFDKHEYEFKEHEGLSEHKGDDDKIQKYYRFNRTQLSAIDYSLADQGNLYTQRFGDKLLEEFEIEELNYMFNPKFDDEEELKKLDNKTRDKIYYLNKTYKPILKSFDFDLTYMGIPMVLPFNACSYFNQDGIPYYYIGNIKNSTPARIKERFKRDSKIGQRLAFFKNITGKRAPVDFVLNDQNFYYLENDDDLKDHIEGDDYMTASGKRICFALNFDQNKENNKFSYSLHFSDFESTGRVYTQVIPMNHKGLWDDFQNGPDLKSFEIYENGLYNYVIKVVNEYMLQEITENQNAKINYAITPMTYKEANSDDWGQFFASTITIVMTLAFMVPLSLYIYKMVYEKESRVKEGMKIMGLGEGIYYFSYFIQFIAFDFIISILSSFLLKVVYEKIPIYFLQMLIFLSDLDIFALVIFFQSFIDKTRISVVLSLIIYFMMFCVSIPVLHESASLGRKIVLGFIPLF